VEQIADSMIIIDKGKKMVEGKVSELINPEKVQVEIISLDNNAAKEVVLASQWAGGLIEASLEKILVETKKELIPDLFKFLVEQGILLISIRSTNTLESYFLSITK
jgi:ABC-type multidrug transport system ATPase subunit